MLTRRTLCLTLSGLALSACATGSQRTAPPPAGPAPASLAMPAVIRPDFGDSDPVDFPGRKPARYPVHGIDAARFQDAADWPTARAAGVNFAFLKATEGGDRTDPMFDSHWRGARAAGIPTSAYHFFYFCTPAEVQARWFIRNVPKTPGMLPPVLDLEWNPFSPTCTHRPEGAVVRREARIFLAALEAHYGQRPVVYTTPEFYRQTGIGKLRAVEFWLRSTAKPLSEVYPGQRWRFWQYSGTGLVPGFLDEVDLNLFNGSAADWAAWLTARRVT
ncbi:glycoside hydrolase family 25 protein [Marimonas arenosa]|uniref:Glycoside hydrolase family 25 protein n=1 Tax=Marimonas arenosa TaxID=1795305 RepID=A0AAE4B5E7_9RHOB|nr:GH25 family lysozyme [Marimonas arenosa]MDQ2091968.1 glycoside hydrolase family 25 protein [Marimonas arenosa]